ncbi:MAG: hypothetical protein H0U44_11555 [Flavisolibacter sp.]|jgi:antitoxin component of MazEF toxin-antitoxin module|nr:hypothetical protein [Flavisolibacter sp.]
MKSKKKISPSGKNVCKNYPSTNSLPKLKPGKKQEGEAASQISVLIEANPSYSISSKLRPIGNSKGVILPNRVIEEAGISSEADLIIKVSNGMILIAEDKTHSRVNTDLSSWEKQFKKVIKMGIKPESDIWDGMQNRFDEEEWT